MQELAQWVKAILGLGRPEGKCRSRLPPPLQILLCVGLGQVPKADPGLSRVGQDLSPRTRVLYNSGLMGISLCEASFGVGLDLVL